MKKKFVKSSNYTKLSENNIQWKPVKATPLKVNNRFTSTADVLITSTILDLIPVNVNTLNKLKKSFFLRKSREKWGKKGIPNVIEI